MDFFLDLLVLLAFVDDLDFLAVLLVLLFAALLLLVLATFFLLVVFFAEDFFALLALDCPGKALQCAFVLLPFLFTEDFRQVQLLLAEQADELNPEHWLAAWALEPIDNVAIKIVSANEIVLIMLFLGSELLVATKKCFSLGV